MKQLVLCAFLAAYSLITVKPALPLVADFFAHIFWSHHHHSHHHHSHDDEHDEDHDHLTQDLKKAAENDAPAKKTVVEKETLWIHLAVDFEYKFPLPETILPDYHPASQELYSDPFIADFSPPPRA